jgi:cell division ATPase FtsA
MKKDLVLSSVQNSVSSIFTKENVITLINLIDEGSSRKITTDDINRAIDKVVDYMDRDQREIFDFDNAEFELNYDNRIECVGVPVNTDAVREILENNFMDFGEAEEDDVVELEKADNEL